MTTLLATSGTISGIVGILLCMVAGLARLSGSFYLLGYEAQTILVAGIAFIAMACFLKLEQLTLQRS